MSSMILLYAPKIQKLFIANDANAIKQETGSADDGRGESSSGPAASSSMKDRVKGLYSRENFSMSKRNPLSVNLKSLRQTRENPMVQSSNHGIKSNDCPDEDGNNFVSKFDT